MAGIAFQDVTKAFDDGTIAVDHLDLEVRDGEFVVLVGAIRLRKDDLIAHGRRS